jgi:hypothetical protein
MRRVYGWIIVLLSVVLIGVWLWPTDSRSLTLLVMTACVVLAGATLRESGNSRPAAMTLGVVASTIILEPALLVSPGGYDVRIGWAALLAGMLLRADARIHTLVAAGVMAVTITPPSDISLLRVTPPVLLQVLVCAVAIALQWIKADGRPWWRVYRVAEPLLMLVVAVALVAPFGRNGLTLHDLVSWHMNVAIAATVMGLLFELAVYLRSTRM